MTFLNNVFFFCLCTQKPAQTAARSSSDTILWAPTTASMHPGKMHFLPCHNSAGSMCVCAMDTLGHLMWRSPTPLVLFACVHSTGIMGATDFLCSPVVGVELLHNWGTQERQAPVRGKRTQSHNGGVAGVVMLPGVQLRCPNFHFTSVSCAVYYCFCGAGVCI